ncbi:MULTISPECIES: helix-turn-helix transcriptional regulator [unclassified Phenylobacterium]|jgi:transcriptional regulator with XRE-family HTH domain|uniref:helix-turn-helix domain-containing protein n=1 Tax=unclassified Phenylobacterium TaxID=2640670 RepID=UPI00083B61C1
MPPCDDIDRQLGLRVRRRRRLLGLTQRELAAICGVRFQQIQKYEAAANKMSAGMIGRLAQALGVEVGYFYAGLEAMLSPPPPDAGAAARATP